MTRKEFINRVIDEITEGGAIPASPNQHRINSIIDNAKLYFYEHDDDAHEYQYLLINKAAFRTQLFKEKRQIALPDEVHAVIRYKTLQKTFRYDMANNPDFKQTQWNFSLGISGDSTALLTSIAVNSYNTFLGKFVLDDIQYEFSSYSHMLTVKGRNAYEDTIAEVTVKINENDLFENERFFRYVCGKCKISFSSIIGFTGQKLIGGYQININDIKAEGKELVKEVLEEQKDQRLGDFLTFFD